MAQFYLLIALLLVVAFFLQVDFIFYVVYVTVGVWLWSVWSTPRALKNLVVRRRFRPRAFHGQAVDIHLELEHRGWQPIPWVQVVESIPPALRRRGAARTVLTLPGRHMRQISYKVQAMKRGYYRLGPLLISSGDLFGFRESRRRLDEDYLTVYPRIVSISALNLPSRLPYGSVVSQRRHFEDLARPIGVRDYQSGDSLRHINWKVSAHSRKLLVKTFEPVISLESMIALNLNQSEYPRRQRYDGPEWAIVVAASIASHLARLRQPVGLATNGADPLLRYDPDNQSSFDSESGRLSLTPAGTSVKDDPDRLSAASLTPGIIPPRSGRANLMKTLEQLARIEARPAAQSDAWLLRATLDLSWGTTIVVISPAGGQRTCKSLHQLVRRGLNPVLMIVDPYADFRTIRKRARSLGFNAFHVGREEALAAVSGPPRGTLERRS